MKILEGPIEKKSSLDSKFMQGDNSRSVENQETQEKIRRVVGKWIKQ